MQSMGSTEDEVEELLGGESSSKPIEERTSVGTRDWKDAGVPQIRPRRYLVFWARYICSFETSSDISSRIKSVWSCDGFKEHLLLQGVPLFGVQLVLQLLSAVSTCIVVFRYLPRSNSPKRRSTLDNRTDSSRSAVGYRRLEGHARIKSVLSNEGSKIMSEQDITQGKFIPSMVTELLHRCSPEGWTMAKNRICILSFIPIHNIALVQQQ